MAIRKERIAEDRQVFLSLIDGDPQAFEKIYKAYFAKVLHFVQTFTMSKQDSEEIVHDVFLKVWEGRSKVDADKNFDAYLYVIARNMVVDRMRKYVAEKRFLAAFSEDLPYTLFCCTEEAIRFDELKQVLDSLMDKLPPKRRMIIKLNREQGMKYREIADLLHISVATVEKQISLGLQSLREGIKATYGSSS